MSIRAMRLIPEDPEYVPTPRARAAAREVLTRLLPHATVEISTTERPELIDNGENLESISCPHCGTEVDEEWWAGRMNAAFEKDFRDLGIKLPCCRRRTTLNDLRYELPMGFARFVLAVDQQAELAAADVAELERLLGTHLRVILAHY